MAKNWNDWTDLMAGKVGEPEDMRSKPVTPGPTLSKGEVPRRPTDQEIRNTILSGAPRQPTDQEMFGRFVVTEEQAKAAQDRWENMFKHFYSEAKKPVQKVPDSDYGSRGPVDHKDRSQLTEEEQRISQIPVDPSLLSGE